LVNTAPEKEVKADWFELADATELFGALYGAGFIDVLSNDLSLIIKDIFCCSSETVE